MSPSPEQSSLNPEGSEEERDKTKETSSEQKESDGDDRVNPKNFQEAIGQGPVNGSDGDDKFAQNIEKVGDGLTEETIEEINKRKSDESEENDDQETDN